MPKREIDLNQHSSNKEERLTDFIMEVAQESMENLGSFRHLVKDSCEDNDGYRLKMGVKIKERTQEKALVRIKEKMLADVFGAVKVEDKLASRSAPGSQSSSSRL